jgi:hypothetical protein
MKKLFITVCVALLLAACCTSCTENYSNGSHVGIITKINQEGLIWNTMEGELNITATGMNSSGIFEFSIDRDNPERQELYNKCIEYQRNGDIIEVFYHKTLGWNWFKNRGCQNYFITKINFINKSKTSNELLH